MTNYWLMKCEPSAYSINDLEKDKSSPWEGVRNYQARNFMRDEMKIGDLAFFYHSNAKPSGIVGLMQVSKESYPDFTACDPTSKYFCQKSSPDKNLWQMVDVSFIKKSPRLISLEDLRSHPELQSMMVLKKGSRLSIQPVTKKEFQTIRKIYEF